jgi:hypothetical protein
MVVSVSPMAHSVPAIGAVNFDMGQRDGGTRRGVGLLTCIRVGLRFPRHKEHLAERVDAPGLLLGTPVLGAGK